MSSSENITVIHDVFHVNGISYILADNDTYKLDSSGFPDNDLFYNMGNHYFFKSNWINKTVLATTSKDVFDDKNVHDILFIDKDISKLDKVAVVYKYHYITNGMEYMVCDTGFNIEIVI